MALEQKLHLKLSQKLVMTPSLQQAIKLLQMTRMELEGVLNQELVENPILEDSSLEDEAPEKEEEEAEGASEAEAAEAEEPETESDPMDDIDLDAYFNDYLDYRENPGSSTYEAREAVPLENTLSEEPDLYEHLNWQVKMSDLSTLRREICEQIIGNLNEDGFLVATIEELQLLGASKEEREIYAELLEAWESVLEERAAADAEPEARAEEYTPSPSAPRYPNQPPYPSSTSNPQTRAMASPSSNPQAASHGSAQSVAALATQYEPEPDPEEQPTEPPAVPGYSRSEVEAAIEFVKTLDPTGIGCRDLQESLCTQLEVLELEDSLAFKIVRDHWPRFLKRQLPPIAKKLGVAVKDLEEPVGVIRGLETRPGRLYDTSRTHYVEPDVEVVKVGDEYVVQLNDDGMPRLRVSGAYRKMLRDMKQEGRESDTQQYIKEKMRSAIWLIKSLDQRQRTIYKVATSIVKQQKAFFERGIDYMRPMVLRDVAEDIEMHESTVSRVVSNKYIHTPRGLFPMKYFFHSGLDRHQGEDISSLTVKKKIKGLIADEDPKRPLSDSELTRRLERDGVNIARRTVAKYRDELGIPSSTDRKELF